jgi:hypothetical protein
VYARTDKTIRGTVRKSEASRKNARVEKEVAVGAEPETCPRCHATKFWAYRGRSQVVYDLRFTRRGIKRWAVRYCYSMYRCSECRMEMTVYPRGSQYGPNLRAFVVYLLIELRLSNQKAIEHVSSLFDLTLKKNYANQIKVDMVEKYMPTYRGILRQIAKGALQFVTFLAAPVASGWSGRRVGLAPTGKRRLVTAHTQLGHQRGRRRPTQS